MNKLQGIAYDEKQPVIFEEQAGGKFYCYDGENYGYIDDEKRREMRSLRTPFILIKKDSRDTKRDYESGKKKNGKAILVQKSLKEIYDEFVKDADELKKATNGLVNMYKSGRDTQTAIYLAYHFLNEKNICPEIIELRESQWLEDASAGALIFGYPYKGEAWKYDLNSAYPSIYSSVNFMVPVQVGDFQTLSTEEFYSMKFFRHGIYRANVEYPTKDEKWRKLFKLNETNKYTSIDLTYAKKIGCNISLMDDGYDNFLCYSRNKCKTGAECFKKYVDLLYPLRKNTIISNRCKSLLRALWGALSQRDVTSQVVRFDEEFNVHPHNDATITILSENTYRVDLVRKNKPYETNYARMKPFLLSKARVKIAEYIEPNIDHVFRCHTDSVTSDIELPIETSMKLGMMKFEGYSSDCQIFNSNKVIGDFNV